MTKTSGTPKHVLITGASQGLGRALALRYAQAEPGRMLSLMGRDIARLEDTAAACRARGAQVVLAAIDVTDHHHMEDWITARDAETPIDLVIACAGLGGDRAVASMWGDSGQQARDLINTNTIGVINTVAPLQRAMVKRKAGHIAIIGSIQGGIGLPQAPAYSASKAALKIYADAMRRLLRPRGVRVTLVLPGFIDTAMSQSLNMPRPWCWSAEKAAKRVARDIARGASYSVFPWQLRLAVAFGAVAPVAISDFVLVKSLDALDMPPREGRDGDPGQV